MEKIACQYARCSTDQQDLSIGDQLKETKLFAEANGYSIIRQPFIDHGVSGVDTQKRLAFLRMIKLIESGMADFHYILVYDTSRWGRFADNSEFGYYFHICKQHGVKIVFIKQNYDDDGSAAAILNQTFDQLKSSDYSRNLSTGSTRGMRSASEKGFWVSTAPYGYCRAELGPDGNVIRNLSKGERKGDKTHHLTLVTGDKKEIEVIKKIFSMAKNGAGGLKIANYLNSQKIPSARGQKWSSDRVTAILRNPVYAGTLIWGRTKVGHFSKWENTWGDSNPNRRFHDEDKWVKRENAFEAIIDKTTFKEVQKKLDERKNPIKGAEGRPYGSQFLLSGVLFCGTCGGKCAGESGHKEVGNRWTTYRCSTRRTFGRTVCGASDIARVPIDHFVLDQIRDALQNPDLIAIIEKRLRDKLTSQSDIAEEEKSIRKDIETCKAGIEGLLDALEDKDNPNRDLVNKRLLEKRERLGKLETEFKACQNRKQEIDDVDGMIRRIKEKVNGFANYISDAKYGEWEINEIKKKIVKEFLFRAVASPDRESVTFYFYKTPIIGANSNRTPQLYENSYERLQRSNEKGTLITNRDGYRVVPFVIKPDTRKEDGHTWYRYEVYAKSMHIHYTTVVKWAARGRLRTKVFYGTKYVCDAKDGDA